MTQRNHAIDGLRALAVLAVLLFHVDKQVLSGGYLGVDLFFVISGYVVSKNLRCTRSSYFAFLGRRFYRLFPAAAFTILATVGLFSLTGSGLLSKDHIFSALSAMFAVSNFYFMTHSSYFSTALEGNPFLHFWSLSVEEQFYLIWPLLILCFRQWKFAWIFIFVALLTLLSWGFFTFFATEAFYFMPARAFQFGAGALIAFVDERHLKNIPKPALPLTLMIALGLMAINDGTLTWIFGVFFPTLIFTLLVASAAADSNNRFLSVAFIQLIGRASYSIYLAHWPIVVYIAVMFGLDLTAKIFAIALSLILGFALFYFVERPFNVLPPRLNQLRGWAAPSLMAAAVGMTSALALAPTHRPTSDTVASSVERAVNAQFERTRDVRAAATRKMWMCNTYEEGRRRGEVQYKLLADLPLDTCLVGQKLLLADSTGEAATGFLATLWETDDFGQLHGAGCGFDIIPLRPDCDRHNALRQQLLTAQPCRYTQVVLAFKLGRYTPERLARISALLRNSTCKIKILSPLPVFTMSPPQIVAAHGPATDLTNWLVPSLHVAQASLSEMLKSLSNTEIFSWSPLDWAPSRLPAMTENGKPIYRDIYHFTPDGKDWLTLAFLSRAGLKAQGEHK
jgi:peptidoglycan/LPS O-acetylase OafA/YrhL